MKKLDASGNHLATWGSRGVKQGSFLHHGNYAYITILAMYMLPIRLNHRIQKFTTEGNFDMWTVGSQEGCL